MNKMIKPKLLSEFLAICSKNRFFQASAGEKCIKNLKILPYTKLLQVHIERVALHTDKTVENSLSVFGDKDFDAAELQLPLSEKYSLIRKRKRATKNTPFKLVEMQTTTTLSLKKSIECDDEQEISVELPANSKSIRFSCFVQDKEAHEYFYRIQRQRKIWWMQYAANPGRFFISEVNGKSENVQSVAVKAAYPFGNLAIEHIELLPIETVHPDEAGKNAIPNQIIRSSTFLDVAAIETILDSIDAGDFGEMCLHRKITPYQCSVYSFSKDARNLRELQDLAKYITMMLSKHRVSIFNLDESSFTIQSDLERKFSEMDAIGIPYGLILDETSLENGVMRLRNRDTTICETIHISYLPQYLLQIFRS